MRASLFAALVAVAVAAPAIAAPVNYGGLTLAPRGDRIASIDSGAGRAAIVIRSARDGKVIEKIDPCATCSYSGLSFAADGALAFLARDRSSGMVTLDIAEGGQVRGIATIKGIAQTPRWSPDGSRIALLVTIGAAKEAGAAQAGVRQVGEIGATSDEQRLAVFDRRQTIAAEAVKPLSPAGRYIYEYDWTPDGKAFVVTSALGNGDDNWWVATLDAVDATTGAVRTIARPATQLNFPRVSPDGKTVAYIGGLMSDFGVVGGDIFTVPFEGGAPVNATEGDKASVTSIDWTAGGLRAVRLRGDQMEIARFVPAKGMTVLWSRAASFAAGDGRAAFSADGASFVTVAQDFERAPAIFASARSGAVQLTHDNDAIKPIVKATSISWTNEGFTSQGWLLAPVDADPARKAPMITVVHGGPSSASTPNFFERGTNAELLKRGFYIFLPNPRGSYGQGEAFTAANRRDFGGGDLRDILAGIDAVEKQAPIDDARLGLTGGSYGGFMAMWTNTQTNRFKAIVAGAGISDWISYYGTNGISTWMVPFFGKPMYEDFEAYQKPSAIFQIAKAKTPTFIYVGERDIEVPPTQSIEYWHALRDLGVPVSLVIYPEEGHGIRNPQNAIDLNGRVIAWFEKYLAAPAN